VDVAVRGTHYLTKEEAYEISQPGSQSILAKEAGSVVDVNSAYVLDKNPSEFGGMGSEIYGKTINSVFDQCEANGRVVRYVHQENHYAGTNDTRGGVYGELNAVEAKHTKKFVSIFPQEAQVMQVGAAMRSTLPKNNLVFVKGPHTIFNEHARDIMKYGAFLMCDRGIPGNVIYVFDGGSIANKDKYKFKHLETGEEVQRDLWLARVGEHHNTPEYSSYAADANTVMCTPMDMNLLSLCMPELIRLYDMGRFLTVVAPTSSFGLLHPKFPNANATFGINDVIRLTMSGTTAPKNGRKLVVLAYGPDSKYVAKVMADYDVSCEFFVFNYNRAPNALVNHLEKNYRGVDTDILLVDQNSDAALYGPVITDMRQKLGYPREWHWVECTTPKTFIPYGYGEPLMQESDVVESLKVLGVIDGAAVSKGIKTTEAAPVITKQNVTDGSVAISGDSVTVVNAPMDGEAVYMSFFKSVGDTVKKNEVVVEVESDKATIEIKAPHDGEIKEFFVVEQEEMDVDTSTKIFSLESNLMETETPSVSNTSTAAVKIINAPMDGEAVYMSFFKAAGDKVSKNEVVVEVESDKATIEIKAPEDGVIKEFLVTEQEEMDVTPETQIFSMELASLSQPAAAKTVSSSADTASGKKLVVNAPMDGEAVYITFQKSVGDAVEKNEVVAEVESDKATIEIKAPAGGVISEFHVAEQEEMDVDTSTKIVTIEESSNSASGDIPATTPQASSDSTTKKTKGKPQPYEDANGNRYVPLDGAGRGMVKAMTIKPDDTRTFNQFLNVDFDKVRATAKAASVTPTIVIVKHLGETVKAMGINKKLSADRKELIHYNSVDIGIAVDVGFGLRNLAIRDVTNKSLEQIAADVQGFVDAGASLPVETMDMSTVCWNVTALGKLAGRFACSVIPPGTTGILSIGLMQKPADQTMLSCAMCHATLTGMEGASMLHKLRESF
jgi:pyruvate/2-oxoglutarate dehydrogenase complex dihydrolipoamide acyltransferase (E2) component